MTTFQPSLTPDERAALYAELNAEMVGAMDAMLKGLIDEQRNPKPDVEMPAPVAPKPAPAFNPNPTVYEDDLDMVEITAHSVLSAIIRGRYIGRSALEDGGFEALYRVIRDELLEVMRGWDMVEVERIYEGLRE